MGSEPNSPIQHHFGPLAIVSVEVGLNTVQITARMPDGLAGAVWGREVEYMSIVWRPEGGPGRELDAIRERWRLARLAGLHADEAGRGWDEATSRAMTSSWADIPRLIEMIKAAGNDR